MSNLANQNLPAESLKAQAEDAYNRLVKAMPEDAKVLGKYLAAVQKQNVIALDNNEAFALRDEQGREIRCTRKNVQLSAENGGLTQPVYNGPFVISAPGYQMLAHASGSICMNAPTVIVDGRIEQNPYVRRDKDGRIVEIYCRALAFRYNEHGQPMVSDRTTIFDVATYSIADMVGKAKRQKDAFKLLPVTAPSPGDNWAAYKVDESINLWMNVTHDESITFLGQVLNRQKKAMEFAQTFAQRNAMKHLLGVAVVPGQGSGRDCKPISRWDVPVACWTPSDGGLVRFDVAKYAASTQVIDALTSGKPVALPEVQNTIVISRGEETVQGIDLDQEADPIENPDRYESDETHAAPRTSTAAAYAPIDVEPEQSFAEDSGQTDEQAEPENWTPAQMKDWNNLQVARENFPDEFEQAIEQCGISHGEVTPATAGEINRAINSLMDAS